MLTQNDSPADIVSDNYFPFIKSHVHRLKRCGAHLLSLLLWQSEIRKSIFPLYLNRGQNRHRVWGVLNVWRSHKIYRVLHIHVYIEVYNTHMSNKCTVRCTAVLNANLNNTFYHTWVPVNHVYFLLHPSTVVYSAHPHLKLYLQLQHFLQIHSVVSVCVCVWCGTRVICYPIYYCFTNYCFTNYCNCKLRVSQFSCGQTPTPRGV